LVTVEVTVGVVVGVETGVWVAVNVACGMGLDGFPPQAGMKRAAPTMRAEKRPIERNPKVGNRIGSSLLDKSLPEDQPIKTVKNGTSWIC